MNKRVRYRERVTPRISSFLPLLLLLPAGWLTTAMFEPALGLAIGAAVAVVVAAAMVYFSTVITIDDEKIFVGPANIGIKNLGKCESFSGKEAFQERGPRLNAKAYVQFQPSLQQLVKIEIKDATDPTPYWLFSTRYPEEILRLLGK